MESFTEACYLVTLWCVGAYKWLELNLLRLISPFIVKKGSEMCESFGVVFHSPGEELTPKEEKRILAKSKYDGLLHVDVKDKQEYFARVVNRGFFAVGTSFMEGMWTCRGGENEMVEFGRRMLDCGILVDVYLNKFKFALDWLELCAFNLQTKSRAFEVGKAHYDLGNDLYSLMLDKWMQYTCAYWARAKNLEEAQQHKMELIAKKLNLKAGMRVLDIGCGWGTLCKYLAENYGVECVGVTISKEGVAYGKEINKGLAVEIRLQDWRDVNEVFDRIVSVGSLEHFGFRNYPAFFQLARKCLKPDGIFLCQTIGNTDYYPRSDYWLHTYIFPNGNVPYANDITKAVNSIFVIEDWHNLNVDYARTLEAWRSNFNANWHKIQHKYGEDFRKMWIFYLTMAEASFRARKLHLWQIVLSPDGIKNGYRAAR